MFRDAIMAAVRIAGRGVEEAGTQSRKFQVWCPNRNSKNVRLSANFGLKTPPGQTVSPPTGLKDFWLRNPISGSSAPQLCCEFGL